MKLRLVYTKNLTSSAEAEMLLKTLRGLIENVPMWAILPSEIVERIDYLGDGWSIKDLIKRILNLIIYKLQKWAKNE